MAENSRWHFLPPLSCESIREQTREVQFFFLLLALEDVEQYSNIGSAVVMARDSCASGLRFDSHLQCGVLKQSET